MRYLVGSAFLFLSVCSAQIFAQQRSLKVLLLCDMEGVSGATDFKHTTFRHAAEYAAGRRSLTADVNAAIRGLKAAGATEVVVVDGHGSGNTDGPDVLEDQLIAPATVLYKDRAFDIYMDSYDHSYDAIVAIAMHAGAGNPIGFLSHTYAGHDVEYTVNGVPFNESMILAAGSARLKIPLIMVSGDDQLEREVRRNMPWVKYVIVKRAIDRARAEAFSPAEVSRRIETAAREALADLASARVPEWPGPYRFRLTFQDEAQAQNAALMPGAELLSNNVAVQIRASDFEEGYRGSVRLIGLAGIVAVRDARIGYVNTLPNAAQMRTAIADWATDHVLNRLPPAPAPTTPAAPQRPRFWGAN